MIYLDNAATSFPKPKSVVKEVHNCITRYCGNPGRSSHKLALAAADKIFETRVLISEFLGWKRCENVIFSQNATHALNLVIKGLITNKCHCIISDLEHNSVIRPLSKVINEYGGEYSVFDTDIPIAKAVEPLIRKDTEVIISTLCSNVTGKIIDLHELSRIATKHNLKLIIDASQYLGHRKIDLSNVYFTALCSAGHKSLFGIQGSAFALINDCKLFDTLIEGGSGVDSFSTVMPILLPERYEPGTLSTPAIASLGAGISFINDVGITEIENKLNHMTAIVKDELSQIPNLTLYGAECGIISFNVGECNSSHISSMLDSYGIATRSGFHCAPLIHKKLGTADRGAVRASLSYFNTESQIHSFCKTVKAII